MDAPGQSDRWYSLPGNWPTSGTSTERSKGTKKKTNGEKGVMRRGVVVRGRDVGVVGVQSSLSRDQNCNLTKRCGVSVAASCFCGAEWLKLS